MAAYAVSARISDVRPYRTTRRAPAMAAAVELIAEPLPPTVGTAPAEYDGREPDGPSWADLVLDWTETTFYLFDPQSWR
jgi:hypothetical protein